MTPSLPNPYFKFLSLFESNILLLMLLSFFQLNESKVVFTSSPFHCTYD